MQQLLRSSVFLAWSRLWVTALLLTLLVPPARAQAPTMAVTPAGPLTLCAGSSQTLTAIATIPGFNAGSGFNGYVSAVLVLPDGKTLVGGSFTSYNGDAAAPDNLLRLNADGSLDPTFNPGGAGSDYYVDDLALQPDGQVLVGGNFTSYNGNAAAPDRLLRLNSDGSLDPTFNPGGSGLDTNATSVLVQPDGKVLVGGNFTSYNGSAAAPDRVLRLNANGSLDTAFNPSGAGADNFVYALALQPDGKVLVGGFFTRYNGQAATYLLRLDATGHPDAGFNAGSPGPNDVVDALAIQPDGKILVGGEFSQYNNAAAPAKLVRLNASGSLDASFNPGGSGASGFGFSYVFTLALQPDGKVLVGGIFANYNGNAAPDMVLRLTATGSLDASFNAGGTGADNRVLALALQPDGQVLVGGNFTSYNGNAAAPDNLLRLNPDGTLNAPVSLASASYTWSNGATGPSITVSQPGLYQATATTPSGTAYSNVVRVNAPAPVKVQVTPAGPLALPFGGSQTLTATATIPGFNLGGSGFDSSVNVVLVQPDGKVVVGGYFTSYNGNAAAPDNLLRLNPDGTLDPSFNNGGSGIGGAVSALALQPDGKILVAGFLKTYNAKDAPHMVLRVNADGSLDTGFNPGGTGLDNGVRALALQADGRILVGGGFVSYNGNAAAPDNLLRLNPDGTLDPSFNNGGASTNSLVNGLAVLPDGKILIVGSFTGYNGSTAAPDYVLRLQATGSLDASFNSGGTGIGGDGTDRNTYVNTLAVQADGRIVLGGSFLSYNGNAAAPDNLLRLNSDGSFDPSFNNGGAGPNEVVFTLAAQPDDKLLVGGYFTGYNGRTAAPDYVLRLNANGTLDTGFNAGGTGTSTYVNTLAIQPDGRVLVGGWFASYNGNAAVPDNLLRLSSDGRLQLDQALPGATFVFNPGASSGNTRTVSTAGSYTAMATDPATGCQYLASPVVVTVAVGDLTVSTGTPASPISIVGTYNNVTVTSTGHAILTGPLQANTTFVVQPGGSLTTNCQPLTGAGSFTLAAGATLYICDPAGLSATGPTGAVQVTGTRSFSPEATYIYNGTVSQITGLGLPTQVRSLGTTNANPLALSQALAVAQTLTLAQAGDFVLNGQSLTLLSNASGTALVVNAGVGVVQGTATVQRYLDPSLNASLGYRHYSSPVQRTTTADLATDTFAPVVNAAYNVAPIPAQVRPFPSVFGYDESRVSAATTITQTFDQGFFSPALLSDLLVPGRGYTANLDATSKVDLVGTLNTGTIAMGTLTRGPQANSGWHLLGNPYPAPLDWSVARQSLPVGVIDAVYVFKSSSQYAGTYQFYQNGFGTLPGGLIGSMQGFFVRVSQEVPSFSFLNSWRVVSAQNPAFNRPAADARPSVQLDLITAQGEREPTFVYFEPGATEGVDDHYDAAKLPNTTGLNLSSVVRSTQLAVNGYPALGTTPRVVPLAMGVPTPGNYSITAQLLNLNSVPVYLRDLFTGVVIDLSQQPSYRFTVSDATALSTGRFELEFSPQQALATVPAALAQQVKLYPNPAQARVFLELPASLGQQAITGTLLDAMGRAVRTVRLPAQSVLVHQLDLHDLPTGVYVLCLRTRVGTVAKKLLIEH